MKQLIKFTVNDTDYKIAVPDTALASFMSSKDMTAIFLDAINKQRNNIKRFTKRKPILETISTLKTTEGESIKGCLTIEGMIHTFTSARKSVYCKLITDESKYDHMFGINFDTGMIVLYKKESDNTFETIGSIPYDTIYSNWADLFFPTDATKEEGEVIDERSVIEKEGDVHPLTDVMMTRLDSRAFEIWNWLYNEQGIKGSVLLEYSGSGDSGGTDDIIFEDDSVTTEQRDQLDKLCWDLIDSKEGGFYNNDGGYGEISVSETKFSWKHYNYITETNQSVNDEVDLNDPI